MLELGELKCELCLLGQGDQQIVPLLNRHAALGTQYGGGCPLALFDTHLQYLLPHHHIHSVLLCVHVCVCVCGWEGRGGG